jgi:hypothetical protein
MKLSLLPKLIVFWVSSSPLECYCTFLQGFFFFNLTLCMTKLRVLVLCFSYFSDNSIVFPTLWCNKRGRYQELMKNFYPLPPPKVQIWICLSSFSGFGSLQLSRCYTCHNTDLLSDLKLIGRILQHWRDTVAILMSILLPAGPEKAVTNPQVSLIACTRKLTWDFVANFVCKRH